MTMFVDTRQGRPTGLHFSDVILKGIADSGGLYVAETLPVLSIEELDGLADMSYAEAAAFVFGALGIDFSTDEIHTICEASYGENFDTPKTVEIVSLGNDLHILELWHGPTSAFKDMALQCMPRFFSAALRKQHEAGFPERTRHILVATSGDTGKAALEGFAEREGCAITVLYPSAGVSEIQRKQMVTQRGSNVDVLGVEGNFDDCQTIVKQIFADKDFNDTLLTEKNTLLSSANSINFGRLMPQIVYYLTSCAHLRKTGALQEGQLLDVCVPTGNFGNILAAYYAKLMGAPIGTLICASNENNILADFIATGTYDISDRAFIETPSPSMDILISSNLERLLYHLSGPEAVRDWMAELTAKQRFSVDEKTLGLLQELFRGDFVTNEDSVLAIARFYEKYDYLCDPHTAVALEVAERTAGDRPVLIVSTAHWAKFAPDVLRALTNTSASDELKEPYASLTAFDQLRTITRLAAHAAPIPATLASLETDENRFSRTVAADARQVEETLLVSLEAIKRR